MLTIRLTEAAGDTPDGVPYVTGAIEEGVFTQTRLTFRAEILEGAFAGRTELNTLIGSFNPDRGTGLVDEWQASVRGDLHYSLEFAEPLRLRRLFDDLDAAFRDGVVYRGNSFDNRIDGTSARDTLYGRDGNDRIAAGGGIDFLRGSSGDDRILGGGAPDIMSGGNGKDVLEAGQGDDRIFAGFGADRLVGGTGGDTMFSETGADTFAFLALGDFGVYRGSLDDRDRIADYEAGVDTVDLSGVDADTGAGGDQAFTYIGRGGFSGTAGELRQAGGFIRGDVDGDGAADFAFQSFNRVQQDDLVL